MTSSRSINALLCKAIIVACFLVGSCVVGGSAALFIARNDRYRGGYGGRSFRRRTQKCSRGRLPSRQHAFTRRAVSDSESSRDVEEACSRSFGGPVGTATETTLELQRQQRRRSKDTYSARFLEDNGLEITTDERGRVTARPVVSTTTTTTPDVSVATKKGGVNGVVLDQQQSAQQQEEKPTTSSTRTQRQKPRKNAPAVAERPAQIVPSTGFNVILTHATADFDSLASAVGLAKLWSSDARAIPEGEGAPSSQGEDDDDNSLAGNDDHSSTGNKKESKAKAFDSASHVPTFVVLPRGAHPKVQRFLALHKHLFPIRSLKSLPSDLANLNRLALVDAQQTARLGPAAHLLRHAERVTVVDHHIDQDSDIKADDYVVDQVGSVTTLITERLRSHIEREQQEQSSQQPARHRWTLTEAEATLLALGIHDDTGNLCFDSTTARDAHALAWCLSQGASQAAIAEHAGQPSLSPEQQGVLTQALVNMNSTTVHGVAISTVLLRAEGFINGLAAVTQDALELSSSDVFLLAFVYEAQSGGRRRKKASSPQPVLEAQAHSVITGAGGKRVGNDSSGSGVGAMLAGDAWKGGDEALLRQRYRVAFDRTDRDNSGTLDKKEVASALNFGGILASQKSVDELFSAMDTDGNGVIDFEEFVRFANTASKQLEQQQRAQRSGSSSPTTMIVIGRVKAGVNVKAVKLNHLLEKYGGGGHPKAASATVRLNDPAQAGEVLQGLMDELVETSLQAQPTVGDFMTAPVLSVQPHMTEKQVEDLFTRYDVRALPVVDEDNNVIGLVTYKEVAAAKQRLWNKEQKRLQRERELAERGESLPEGHANAVHEQRKRGSTVKGWMLQHIRTVEASNTMSEVETVLLDNDVGCIPVVADGTKQLVGLVTRTDLLRQHRYYSSLHYHNKAFTNSIAARKPIIELRRRLKKFDVD